MTSEKKDGEFFSELREFFSEISPNIRTRNEKEEPNPTDQPALINHPKSDKPEKPKETTNLHLGETRNKDKYKWYCSK